MRVAPVAADSPVGRTWRLRSAATVELLPRLALRDHPVLRRLGLDLLAGPITPRVQKEILARAASRSPRSIAELLLDQQVACGIGNVYKHEVLFLDGLHPDTASATLAPTTLAALYQNAADWLVRNTGSGPRTTRPGGRGGALLGVPAGRPAVFALRGSRGF